MMKILLFLSFTLLLCAPVHAKRGVESPMRTIIAFGGDIHPKLVRYVAEAAGKPYPKICYIPTASADSPEHIGYWESVCRQLPVNPYVLRVWVDSNTKQSFCDQLLEMDAIIVGGGNTLNMLGIWHAQEIDEVLREAWRRGVVLAGGSAGSICWFACGVSDARPGRLSVVEGLGMLPYSHCPHYWMEDRHAAYCDWIMQGRIGSGYACDDRAAVMFRNGKFVEAVTVNERNNAYYVRKSRGGIEETKLDIRMLVDSGALSAGDYTRMDVNQIVRDLPHTGNRNEPLEAFVSFKHFAAEGRCSQFGPASCAAIRGRLANLSDTVADQAKREKTLGSFVCRVLIYGDCLAGVVSRLGDNFYGIWYFIREDGQWLSGGEDIGGETVGEAEIAFRERARTQLERIE